MNSFCHFQLWKLVLYFYILFFLCSLSSGDDYSTSLQARYKTNICGCWTRIPRRVHMVRSFELHILKGRKIIQVGNFALVIWKLVSGHIIRGLRLKNQMHTKISDFQYLFLKATKLLFLSLGKPTQCVILLCAGKLKSILTLLHQLRPRSNWYFPLWQWSFILVLYIYSVNRLPNETFQLGT